MFKDSGFFWLNQQKKSSGHVALACPKIRTRLIPPSGWMTSLTWLKMVQESPDSNIWILWGPNLTGPRILFSDWSFEDCPVMVTESGKLPLKWLVSISILWMVPGIPNLNWHHSFPWEKSRTPVFWSTWRNAFV